ncbi:hypothetical protein PPERSA_01637 [Pseudocohnilembus persalinus]|uniref:Uncharacterized protein n=1 Tax=Pseudocohnilembus persalinus TaxID=266149 RepID=A0A0V0R4M3_PSEPJ|nr:hypothetical protein PPERSA_01637 [Pseudocohnilembus persalinus]|eukprot:KRX09437.1 hypothetical protein PPERSA_01637 [Pseudocohnilembus persalinus]
MKQSLSNVIPIKIANNYINKLEWNMLKESDDPKQKEAAQLKWKIVYDHQVKQNFSIMICAKSKIDEFQSYYTKGKQNDELLWILQYQYVVGFLCSLEFQQKVLNYNFTDDYKFELDQLLRSSQKKWEEFLEDFNEESKKMQQKNSPQKEEWEQQLIEHIFEKKQFFDNWEQNNKKPKTKKFDLIMENQNQNIKQMQKADFFEWLPQQISDILIKFPSWKYFQGEPEEHEPWKAKLMWYVTYQFDKNEENEKVEVNVDVKIQENSWAREQIDNELLHHEWGHYLIGCLCALDFKKKCLEQKFHKVLYKNQINNLFKSCLQSYLDLEEKYDIETEHKLNKNMQIQWNSFLMDSLKQYSLFFQSSNGLLYYP